MYKSDILKKVKSQDSNLEFLSDEKILNIVKERYPNLRIEDDPGFLEKAGEVIGSAGLYVGEVGGKVLEGVDNAATDYINVVGGGIAKNVLGMENKENISPFRHKLGIKNESNYKGGLLQKSSDRIGEFTDELKDTNDNFLSDINLNNNIFKNIGIATRDIAKSTYDTAGGLLSTGFGIAGDGFMSGLDTVVPDETQEELQGYVAKKYEENGLVTRVIDELNTFNGYMEKLKVEDPERYKTAKATFGFLEGIGGIVAKPVGEGLKSLSKGALNSTKNTIKKLGGTKLVGEIKKANDFLVNQVGGKIKDTGGKLKNVKNPFKTSKEYVSAISPEGKKFDVEASPKFYDNVTDTIFGSNDKEELAIKSIFPKMTKEKGTKAKLGAGKNALEGVEQLYNDKARGIVTRNINDMGGAVEGVDEALEYWGKQIGDITKSDVVIDFSPEIDDLAKSIGLKSALFNKKAHGFTKDLIDTFKNIGNKLNVAETQEVLSNIKAELFSNIENIKNFNKSSLGRKTLKFLDDIQTKLDDTIEKTSGNSELFLQAKNSYKKYKRIQKDLTDSYIIAQRNSNKGIAGMAGQLGGAYEILQNPFSVGQITKGVALKHIGDLIGKSKTRNGNWEKLIRMFDREAMGRIKNKNNSGFINNFKEKAYPYVDRTAEKIGAKVNFMSEKDVSEYARKLEKIAKDNNIDFKINKGSNKGANVLKTTSEINRNIPKNTGKKSLKAKKLYEVKYESVENMIKGIDNGIIKGSYKLGIDKVNGGLLGTVMVRIGNTSRRLHIPLQLKKKIQKTYKKKR